MEVTHRSDKLFFVQEEFTETNDFPAPMPEDRLQNEDLLPPTPNNPPWNSWVAVGVWIASIVFIAVLQALFLLIYAAQNREKLSGVENVSEFLKNDPGASFWMIAAVIPAHILTLVLAWGVVTNLKKYSFKEMLGWRFDKFKIWYIFAITAIVLGIGAGVTSYFGEQENEFLRILNSSRNIVFLVAFLGTFTAPIVEEVIYRGVMYSAFQRTFNTTAAVIFVTFLFTLVHALQYDLLSVSIVGLLSLILTLIRAYTNNLLPCIALHFVFNGVQSLFLVLQPFIEKSVENPETKAAIVLYLFN